MTACPDCGEDERDMNLAALCDRIEAFIIAETKAAGLTDGTHIHLMLIRDEQIETVTQTNDYDLLTEAMSETVAHWADEGRIDTVDFDDDPTTARTN